MNACEFVSLRHGPIVPVAPLRLLWTLEDRGLRFRLDGDDIIVSPKELMSDQDRALLRRWKLHVRAILDYCDTSRADYVQ